MIYASKVSVIYNFYFIDIVLNIAYYNIWWWTAWKKHVDVKTVNCDIWYIDSGICAFQFACIIVCWIQLYI